MISNGRLVIVLLLALLVHAWAAPVSAASDAVVSRDVAMAIAANLPGDVRASTGTAGTPWRVVGDDWDVKVEVDHGNVTLNGRMPSKQVLGRALVIARGVPGVLSVRPNVDIRQPATSP